MTPCLTTEQLDRYRHGQLTEQELAAIEAHLDSCARCDNALLLSVSTAAESLRQQLLPATQAAAPKARTAPDMRRLVPVFSYAAAGLSVIALGISLSTLRFSQEQVSRLTRR